MAGGLNAGFLQEVLRRGVPKPPLGIPLSVRLPRALVRGDALGENGSWGREKGLDVVFVMDGCAWYRDWDAAKETVVTTLKRFAACRASVRCGLVQFEGGRSPPLLASLCPPPFLSILVANRGVGGGKGILLFLWLEACFEWKRQGLRGRILCIVVVIIVVVIVVVVSHHCNEWMRPRTARRALFLTVFRRCENSPLQRGSRLTY